MFQEAPIYRQLIAERGDVPAQVRGEAERIRRDLQRVMPPLEASAPAAAERTWPAAPAGLALPPGAPQR
ncbi:hypothetical protein AB0M19_11950 [Streptomyces sp. NPDC051920]|uniref:hypothetical protein n=1 Tax=Streptomyces sp. NPDC051920 TaxID=3155523 RepID=UPI00341FE1C7